MSRSRATATHLTLLPETDTIGYVRVSTDQQTGEHKTSLSEQRRAIIQRALELGRVLIPAAIFEDPGVSGATAEGRPGFMAMLAHCEAHKRPKAAPGLVIVLNDSRFGRFEDPKESLLWQFTLENKFGWKVRFAEGDEHGEGMGRDVVRLIGSAQASEYRANLRRTAKRASRATAAQGRWQNEAPMGYRRLAIRPDRTQRVLEIGQRKADDEIVRLTFGPEEEQTIVRWCFAQYAGGLLTLGQLARQLMEKWPARRWSTTVVNHLLVNPAYVGDVVWNRRPHDREERRATAVRPSEEWTVSRDAHQPMVSRELFAAAGARLIENKKMGRAAAGEYPLSGLIRCASCDDRFIGAGGKKGPAHDVDRYRQYAESGSSRPAYRIKCPGRIATLARRKIEPLIVNEIATVVSNPRVLQAIEKELDRALHQAMGGTRDRTIALKKEQERLEAQRQRLVDAIAAGAIDTKDAGAKMLEIRDRLAAVAVSSQQTQFSERRVRAMGDLRERVLALATNFPELAKRAKGSALRELIRPWLADAKYNKHTHVLTVAIRRVPDIGMPATLENGCSPSTSPQVRAAVRAATKTGTHDKSVVLRRFVIPLHPKDMTHCAKGHPLTGDNVYVPPGEPHRRHCRRCKAMRQERQTASRRVAREAAAS